MENILQNALKAVRESEASLCKFITANDTGTTKSHQSGFHLPMNSWEMFFDDPRQKGTLMDKRITIRWQDDHETSSRVVYYGEKTRNEFRITRLGRNFPYRTDENVGDLLIICKRSSDHYEAFILQRDADIEEFISSLNLSISDVNKIIKVDSLLTEEDKLFQCFLST